MTNTELVDEFGTSTHRMYLVLVFSLITSYIKCTLKQEIPICLRIPSSNKEVVIFVSSFYLKLYVYLLSILLIIRFKLIKFCIYYTMLFHVRIYTLHAEMHVRISSRSQKNSNWSRKNQYSRVQI